jgi:stage V sporulation protein B
MMAITSTHQSTFFNSLFLILYIPFTICLVAFPSVFLKLIYNTDKGISYIRFLAPICLLQYIQAPLSSSLDAMGLSNKNFYANLIGSITRIVLLPILSIFKIGLWGLVISTSINIVVVTFINIKQIKLAIYEVNPK